MVSKISRGISRLRILLLSPNQINKYNWGHQLFRNEISKYTDVFYYGPGYPQFNDKLTVPEIVSLYGPFDVLLTYGLRYTLPFRGIGEVKKVLKCHIVVDLFPSHHLGYKGSIDRYKSFVNENKYDLYFYRQRIQKEYLRSIGVKDKTFWLPFSVDINVYKELKLQKKFDGLTSSTTRQDVYPNRVKVNKLVLSMGLKAVTKRVVHYDYVKCINQSKICIISTNIFSSPNMKFTEFTSCGTFVLADRPQDFNELGFVDSKHLVLYKSLNDLRDKIEYYLKNNKEREEIALNGMNFVRNNHNNKIRVEQMLQLIEKCLC